MSSRSQQRKLFRRKHKPRVPWRLEAKTYKQDQSSARELSRVICIGCLRAMVPTLPRHVLQGGEIGKRWLILQGINSNRLGYDVNYITVEFLTKNQAARGRPRHEVGLPQIEIQRQSMLDCPMREEGANEGSPHSSPGREEILYETDASESSKRFKHLGYGCLAAKTLAEKAERAGRRNARPEGQRGGLGY